MKKIKLSFIIITINIVLILLFSTFIFIFISNSFSVDLQKRFKTDLLYSKDVVFDLIEEEKEEILKNTRTIANDKTLLEAILNKKFFNRFGEKRYTDKPLKSKKVNKIKFLLMSKFLFEKIVGRSNDIAKTLTLEIFDEKGRRLSKVGNINKNELSNMNDYYINLFYSKNKFDTKKIVSTFSKKNKKIFLKGIEPILYAADFFGLIVISKPVDGFFLQYLKKIVNKEILLIEDGKVLYSTIYKDTKMINNIRLNFFIPKNLKNDNYFEIFIDKKLYGLSVFPVIDYRNKTIFHIAVASNTQGIKTIRKKYLRDYFIMLSIITIVFLTLFYITLRFTFSGFTYIKNSLKRIEKGNYNFDIKNSLIDEFSILSNGINSLSESVNKREKAIKHLNENLERKIKKRTYELEIALQKIEETQDETILNEKLFSISTIADGIAHELNSPLGAIVSNIQLIISDVKSDQDFDIQDFTENLEIIEQAAKKSQNIVYKLKKGKTKIEKFDLSEIDLSTSLKTAITSVQKENPLSKGIIFNININDNIKILGNTYSLIQSFENILINSIDAIEIKEYYGDEKRIDIELYKSQESCVLEIQDNGIGIPNEIKHKIYDPFFTTKGVGNFGMGLSTTYDVLKDHNAKISFLSIENKGTKFIIKFFLV